MSMEFAGEAEDLRLCPECGSGKLVVAVYRDSLQRNDPEPRPTLECEGCWSVVAELTHKQVDTIRARTDDPLEE